MQASRRSRVREKGAWRKALFSPLGLALLLIFALALWARWRYSLRTGIYTYDSYYYLTLGRNLASHLTYSIRGVAHFKFLPLYPATIAFASFFTRDVELAGNLVNVVCFSACILPIYGIGRRCFGRRLVGLIAAFLFALEPLTITWASLPMSEGLYVLLICLSIYLLVRWWQEDGDGWLWGCAALGGLAAVTRWEGLVMLAVLGLPVLWRMHQRGCKRKALLIAAAIFLTPFALWALRNLIVLGNPFSTAYSKEVSGHPKEWEGLSTWMRFKRYVAFSDYAPIRYTNQLYNYGLLVTGYAGFLVMAVSRRWRRWLVLFIPWIFLLGPFHFLWYFTSSRFLVGAVPALCLGAGLTLSLPLVLASRLDARLPVKAGLVLITLVATAAIGLGSFPLARDLHEHYVLGLENDNAGLAMRDAVKWMKDNVPEDAVVVSDAGPMTSFYLGRDALFLGLWQGFDPADIEPHPAVEQMRAKGVEYLVVFAYTASVEDAFKLADIPLEAVDDFAVVKVEKRESPYSNMREAYAFVLRLKD
jgi:4-amino-4-deoxy-L-arabinose transferase-like glycosyltransferase